MPEDRWLSVDDVAAYLGVKRFTVYRWIEARGLPAHKRGKLWLLRKSDVDRWVVLGHGGTSPATTAGSQPHAEAPVVACFQRRYAGDSDKGVQSQAARKPASETASDTPPAADLAGSQPAAGDDSAQAIPELAQSQVGVAIALAAGVDMPLRIEALPLTGHGNVVPTGAIRRVMPESAAQAAAFVRSHMPDLGLSPAALALTDIALVAEVGEIPAQTDTLAAAVALSIVSALSQARIRRWTATAGQLLPDGRLGPVSDVAQRIRAAVRGGMREVLLPCENAEEARSLPFIRGSQIKVTPVSHFGELLQLASTRSQLDMFKMAGNSGRDVRPTEPAGD